MRLIMMMMIMMKCNVVMMMTMLFRGDDDNRIVMLIVVMRNMEHLIHNITTCLSGRGNGIKTVLVNVTGTNQLFIVVKLSVCCYVVALLSSPRVCSIFSSYHPTV